MSRKEDRDAEAKRIERDASKKGILYNEENSSH